MLDLIVDESVLFGIECGLNLFWMLVVVVVNCLSVSFLFVLCKFKNVLGMLVIWV